jgi:hypothetical protein
MFYPSITELKASEPFDLQLARGLIPGHTSLNITGYQAAIGTTFIPIWENATPYVYPVAASQMLVYSSSASDTSIVLVINGLNSLYEITSEVIVLTNGTNGVTTTKSYLRINGIAVAGSVNPVGDISIGNAGKTAVYAKIKAGAGISSMTVYTVPANYTFYLAKVNCYTHQGNNKKTNYRSYTVSPTGIVRAILEVPFELTYVSEKSVQRGYAQKTDCQWQCKSDVTSEIGMQIEGILVRNED